MQCCAAVAALAMPMAETCFAGPHEPFDRFTSTNRRPSEHHCRGSSNRSPERRGLNGSENLMEASENEQFRRMRRILNFETKLTPRIAAVLPVALRRHWHALHFMMASSELTRAAFATALRSQDDISSLLLAKRRLQSRVESQEAELEQLRADLKRERFVNSCVDWHQFILYFFESAPFFSLWSAVIIRRSNRSQEAHPRSYCGKSVFARDCRVQRQHAQFTSRASGRDLCRSPYRDPVPRTTTVFMRACESIRW